MRDLSKIAAALDVPRPWLAGGAVGGFLLLVLAGAAGSVPLGIASAAFGLLVIGVGIRAMVRPSRPIDLQDTGIPLINSSRRVGGFYVFAGLVWVLVSIIAPHVDTG